MPLFTHKQVSNQLTKQSCHLLFYLVTKQYEPRCFNVQVNYIYASKCFHPIGVGKPALHYEIMKRSHQTMGGRFHYIL